MLKLIFWQIAKGFGRYPQKGVAGTYHSTSELVRFPLARQDGISTGFNYMLRVISLFGMAGGFLLISPSLRGSVLFGLGEATTQMSKYSPYSYIVLALALGAAAVWSLASPKPQ